MYHPYSKDNPFVRKALYEAYSKKCAYCGDLILPKNMHVDHILATNAKKTDDRDFNQYIDELNGNGFCLDSIENYHPSCAACNLKKNNRNFNVATLRFYHSEAQNKSTKILSLIGKYQAKDVSFEEFDPEYDYWEKVDFSHQKDISEAIAGYRLQPSHVCACPRLAQVEEIKKKLDIVDYVIVQGEPGCGKSITVYQAAFDLSKQGYIVYRYVNKHAEDTIFLPQSNERKHLIIIDDAQNLPQFLLEQILSQSREQTKVLLAITQLETDARSYSEPIRITNYDAVRAIARDYTSRKLEILPIVQKFDKYVGDGMMDTPFESRIRSAAEKNTPWLFNYTLRGGWNTTNEQFQAVYNHKKCGLLSAIIALFQILKMDAAVDFKWLQSYIKKLDDAIIWTDDDLDYLIKNKLVTSIDDVRIVHIESAKTIIRTFYRLADKASKQLIAKVVEFGYKDQIFSEQGLIWLEDATFSSEYNIRDIIFTETLLDSVFSNLEVVAEETRRGHVAYFLERMFNLNREKNGRHYFKQNEHILEKWIQATTGKNAYAFSRLLNALHNERNDTLKSFVSKLDIISLLHNFTNSPIEDLYAWSNLLERLSCAYDKTKRAEFGELLRVPLITKSHVVTIKTVAIFFYSLAEMYYLNPNLILELLENNIDKFRSLCMSNTESAMNVFDFHLICHVCGVPYFGHHKPSKQQRDFSKKLVNALPAIPIADYISHSLPRNWHRLYEFGQLLHRENKKLYSKIVKAIDYDALSKSSFSLWKKTDGDLHLLFSFIICGDQASGQRFYAMNKDRIEELGLTFVEDLPEQAIELFGNGVKLRLFENCWNNVTFCALEHLHSVSESKYKAILESEVSQLATKISEFCILDFGNDEKTLYEVLAYINETHKDIILKIVPLLDFAVMKEEKRRMLEDSRCDRRCKKQFQEMVDLLIKSSNEAYIDELTDLKTLK